MNRKRKASCLEELQEIAKFPECIIRHCVEPYLQNKFDFKQVIGQLNFIFNNQKFACLSLRTSWINHLNFQWNNVDGVSNRERLSKIFERVKTENGHPEDNYADYFNRDSFVQAATQFFIRYPEAKRYSFGYFQQSSIVSEIENGRTSTEHLLIF